MLNAMSQQKHPDLVIPRALPSFLSLSHQVTSPPCLFPCMLVITIGWFSRDQRHNIQWTCPEKDKRCVRSRHSTQRSLVRQASESQNDKGAQNSPMICISQISNFRLPPTFFLREGKKGTQKALSRVTPGGRVSSPPKKNTHFYNSYNFFQYVFKKIILAFTWFNHQINTYFCLHFHGLPNTEIFKLASLNSVFCLAVGGFSFSLSLGRKWVGCSVEQWVWNKRHTWILTQALPWLAGMIFKVTLIFYCSHQYRGNKTTDRTPRLLEVEEIMLIKCLTPNRSPTKSLHFLYFASFYLCLLEKILKRESFPDTTLEAESPFGKRVSP